MLKNISRLEVVINEKSYQLTCDMDSTLKDIKEALFQYSKYIGHIEDQVNASIEQKKQENPPSIEEKNNP